MVPAEEVAGDYFDIQVAPDGRVWFTIGDVSGHGVTSGLVMMTTQTAVATALQRSPGLTPAGLLDAINGPLTTNVARLKEHKFVTLTAFAYEEDGLFRYAGLHQDLLVMLERAGRSRRCSGSFGAGPRWSHPPADLAPGSRAR
jgi:sigma-B regulation protein RsbU (phosphoserine phosphatase)